MPPTPAFDDPPRTPVEEHRFPCTTCGSDLRFDPQQNLLVCDYCGNTESISDRRRHQPIAELDFSMAIAPTVRHRSNLTPENMQRCAPSAQHRW